MAVFDDGRTSGRHRTVAATNNCLARSNKSRAENNATIRCAAVLVSAAALRGASRSHTTRTPSIQLPCPDASKLLGGSLDTSYRSVHDGNV